MKVRVQPGAIRSWNNWVVADRVFAWRPWRIPFAGSTEVALRVEIRQPSGARIIRTKNKWDYGAGARTFAGIARNLIPKNSLGAMTMTLRTTRPVRDLGVLATAGALFAFAGMAQAATVSSLSYILEATATGTPTQALAASSSSLPAVFDEFLENASPGATPLVVSSAGLTARTTSRGAGRVSIDILADAFAQGDGGQSDTGFAESSALTALSGRFVLESAHRFVLTGEVEGAPLATALFVFSGPDGGFERTVDFSDTGTPSLFTMSDIRVLGAGEYTLTANGNAFGSYDSGVAQSGGVAFSLNIDLTPVPLPAALPLFFGAVFGLFAYGRRKLA